MSNAVARQIVNDIKSVLVGFLLNGLADDVERLSRFGNMDCLRQRGPGCFEQLLQFRHAP